MRTTASASRRLCRVALAVTLALCAACHARPTESGGGFESAMVMDDGRTGFFTATWGEWHREGGQFLEGPGARVFDRDRIYVGAVDLATGEARLLHAEDAEPGALGQSGYRLRSTRGSRALLLRHVGPNAQSKERAGWFQLDVERGTFERMPLQRELDEQDAGTVDHALLVSDAGDVLVAAKREEGERPTLWLRRASGSYVHVADRAQYHGVKDGELLLWTPEAKTSAWSIATGASRPAHSRETSGLDHYRERLPQAALMARERRAQQESFLELYPDRSESKASRPLPLRAGELE